MQRARPSRGGRAFSFFLCGAKHEGLNTGISVDNDEAVEATTMLVVTSPEVALGIEDPDVRRLVWKRFHQITEGEVYDYDRHGQLVLIQEGDRVADLEEKIGCPILHDFAGARFGDADFSPVFEAIEDHPGCYEIVAILNDDGFGVALFVPKGPNIDRELRAMCARHAQPAKS